MKNLIKVTVFSNSTPQNGVNVFFEVTGEDGNTDLRSVQAQLVVGADGIRSRVRKILVGDEPRYVRCLNWNAILPNPNRRSAISAFKSQASFSYLFF